MKDNEFKSFLFENLKQRNPESYLSQQEKLDLAFKRALELTTPARAGRAADHPDSPRNPYKIYEKEDDDDGWI